MHTGTASTQLVSCIVYSFLSFLSLNTFYTATEVEIFNIFQTKVRELLRALPASA
jgi:hypothetical protein